MWKKLHNCLLKKSIFVIYRNSQGNLRKCLPILRHWWILPETIVCTGCLSPNSPPLSFRSCLSWWKVLIYNMCWLKLIYQLRTTKHVIFKAVSTSEILLKIICLRVANNNKNNNRKNLEVTQNSNWNFYSP